MEAGEDLLELVAPRHVVRRHGGAQEGGQERGARHRHRVEVREVVHVVEQERVAARAELELGVAGLGRRDADGVAQQQRPDPLGMGHRQGRGDEAAHRVARDVRTLDAEPVEQRRDPVGLGGGGVVGTGGEAGRAVPGELRHDDAVVAQQVPREAHPHHAVGRVAVQQHHDRCIPRAAVEDRERGVADGDAALTQAVRPRLRAGRGGVQPSGQPVRPRRAHLRPRDRTTAVTRRW
nr:hypothetical protein [Nocardioides sp. SYSU D00778]